jgi:phosphoribosylformylglycinamidine synthase
VGEALTNLCSVGGIELARVVLSANWMAAAGAEGQDQALYDAVRAVGMELCPALGIAIPVGKDSLSMRTRWEGGDVVSPLTLIVSAFAPSTDVTRAVTPQLQLGIADTRLLLIDLGAGRNRLGLSSFAQCYQTAGGAVADVDDPQHLKTFFFGMQWLHAQDVLLAYHDRSDGGLLVCALEMMFAGRCGLRLDIGEGELLPALFSEELGALVQVRAEHVSQVAAALPGLRVQEVGQPRAGDRFEIHHRGRLCFEQARGALQQAWASTSYEMQRLRDNPECADEEFAQICADDPGLRDDLTFDLAQVAAANARWRAAPARPRLAVLREQGVNGQLEMAAAFHHAGFDAIDVHMTDLVAGRVRLSEFPALVACGGFSYGDVLGAGGGWAKSILNHGRLRDEFAAFFAADRLALGVCNGCQMFATLKELIPGAQHWPRFLRNRSEQFEGRTVLVRIAAGRSPWLAEMDGSVLPVAVAHGEGRAQFAGPAQRAALEDAGQVCVRYVDNHHQVTERYPANPNGTPGGITGISAADGRVLAMMPHPERVFRAGQNPWRNPAWGDLGPWQKLFANAAAALR